MRVMYNSSVYKSLVTQKLIETVLAWFWASADCRELLYSWSTRVKMLAADVIKTTELELYRNKLLLKHSCTLNKALRNLKDNDLPKGTA